MCKNKKACRECAKLSGTMKRRGRKSSKLNTEYVAGLGLGVIASPVAAQLAAKVVPASYANSASGITGAVVAGAGYYLAERSGTKSQMVKGLGHGMIAGGANIAVGASVRNVLDGVLPNSPSNAASNALISTINKEARINAARLRLAA